MLFNIYPTLSENLSAPIVSDFNILPNELCFKPKKDKMAIEHIYSCQEHIITCILKMLRIANEYVI